MTANQDTIDDVTARLTGHDPRKWDPPQRSPFGLEWGPYAWYVMRRDSHIEYFATEQEALHFKRTGAMPQTSHLAMTRHYDI